MKTNHTFRILSLLAATVLLSACSKEPADDPEPFVVKNWVEGQPFVYAYLDLKNGDSFEQQAWLGTSNQYTIYLLRGPYMDHQGYWPIYKGAPDYQTLQAKYGDYGRQPVTSANDTKAFNPADLTAWTKSDLNFCGPRSPGVGADGFSVCAKRVKSIDIIAKTDYDANHPAGSLLNDVFQMFYYDIESFIKDNYPASEDPVGCDMDWLLGRYNIHSRYLKFEPLTDYNLGEPKLFHFPQKIHFYSKIAPTVNLKNQRFTIRFTFEDGQTVDMDKSRWG